MFRNKLAAPTVETCRYRRDVRGRGHEEMATCRLLRTLLGRGKETWCQVRRDACDACCQSFPPSAQSINPVVASLVYHAASRILEGHAAGDDLEQVKAAARQAASRLHLSQHEQPRSGPMDRPTATVAGGGPSLAALLPSPARRHGPTVRQWAVGVQTSPRREATLEACLTSLLRAGWDRPCLFIDSAVRVPDRFAHLPGTFRDARMGAWPSYYLALAELMMRRPHADAYMLVQDDVVFFDRENLRQYLEEILWPCRRPALVSLYCSAYDTQPQPGWHRRRRAWGAGPLAMVFPTPLAKAFVLDENVFGHRWDADPERAVRVVDVLDKWIRACRLDVWFPTPSLAQHIGETSTVWDVARSTGPRRANRFAGDMGDAGA